MIGNIDKISHLAGLLTTIAVIGPAIDMLIINKGKCIIYNKALAFWLRIEEMEVKNLPVILACYMVQKYIFLKEEYGLVTVISFWIVSDMLLTTYMFHYDIFFKFNFKDRIFFWPNTEAYLVNLILDTCTLLVSYNILKYIAKSNSLKIFLALSFDFIIAATLTVLCFILLHVAMKDHENTNLKEFGRYVQNSYFVQSLKEEDRVKFIEHFFEKLDTSKLKLKQEYDYYKLAKEAPLILLNIFKGDILSIQNGLLRLNYGMEEYSIPVQFEISRTSAMMSLTVFIPTLAYYALMVIAFIAKNTLMAYKFCVSYYLRVFLQNDPDITPRYFLPFTMVSVILVIFASILKCSINIAQIVFS